MHPEITHFTVHPLNSQLYLIHGPFALSNLWINCAVSIAKMAEVTQYYSYHSHNQ